MTYSMNNLVKSLQIIFSFQKECSNLSPEDEEAYFEAILKMSRYLSVLSEQNQFTFNKETVDLLQIIVLNYISFIIEFYMIEEYEKYVKQLFTLLSILSDIIEKKVVVPYRSQLVESIGHKLFKFLNDVNYPAPKNEIVKWFNELLTRVKHKCNSEDFISDLCKLMKYLSICGDYEQQEVCLELIIRIFPEVNEIKSAKLFFPESQNLATALTAIHKKSFIADARVFLNILNNVYESVISLRSNEIYLKNRRLFPNKSVSDLWVDINFGTSSIGIYCSSNCLLMNPNGDDDDFVELIRVREENIESIGEFINKTVETTSWQIVIKLSSPVTTCLESSKEFANTAKLLKIMFEEIPSVSNLQGYFSNLFPKKYNRKSSITIIETGTINNNKSLQSDSEESEEIVEDLDGLNSENESNDAESNNSSYDINDSNKTENGKNVLSSGKFELKSLANLGKIENTSSRNQAPTTKDSRMSPSESVTLSYMDSNKIQHLQKNHNSCIISIETDTINNNKNIQSDSEGSEELVEDLVGLNSENESNEAESNNSSYDISDSNKTENGKNVLSSGKFELKSLANLGKIENISRNQAPTSKDSRMSPSESVTLSYMDSNKIQHLQKNRNSCIVSIETDTINNTKNLQSDSEGSEEIVENLGGLNSENESNDAESNNYSYEINDFNITENGKNVLSSGKFELKSLANIGKIENTSSRNRAPPSKDFRMSPSESVALSYMNSNNIQYLQKNRNSSIISFETGTNLSKKKNASSTKRESTSKDFRTSPSESVDLSYMDSNKIQHLQKNRNSSIISFESGTNLSKERNSSSKKRESTSKDFRTSPSESVDLSYMDSNKIQHLQKNRNSSIISFESGTNLSKEGNASSKKRASTFKDSKANSSDIIALSYMDLNKIQQLPKNRRSFVIGIKTDTINNFQSDSEGSEEIVEVLDARDNGSNIENVNNDAESNFSHEINDTNEAQNRNNVLISEKFQLKFINDEKVGSDHDYVVRSPENDHQDSTGPSRAHNVGGRNHSGSITSGIFDFSSKVNEIEDNNFVQSLDSILSKTLTKDADNESDIHEQVDNGVANDNRKGKQKIGNRRKLDKKALAKMPNLKKIQKQRTNENKKVRKSKKPNSDSEIQDNLFLHPDQSEDKKFCTDDNTRNKAKLSLNKQLSSLSCISNELSQKKLDSTNILETRDNDLRSKNDNEINEEIIITDHDVLTPSQENDQNSIDFNMISNVRGEDHAETSTNKVENECNILEQVDNIIANDNPKGKQKIGYKKIIAKKFNAKKPTLKKIQKQSINEIDENEKVRKIKKPNAYREIQGNLPSYADQTEDKNMYTDDNSRIKAMKLSLNKHLSELSCISNELSQKKLDSTKILETINNDLRSKNDNETAKSKSYLARIDEEIIISDDDVFIPSQENDQNSIDFSIISNVRGGNHAETSIKKVENESKIHEQVDNIIANDNPEGKQKIGYKKIIAKKFNAKEPTLKKIPKQSINELDENEKVRKIKKPNAYREIQGNLPSYADQTEDKNMYTDDNSRIKAMKLSLNKHLSELSCISNELSQKKLDSTKILETINNDLRSKNDNETAKSKSYLAPIDEEIIISDDDVFIPSQENDQNSIDFSIISNVRGGNHAETSIKKVENESKIHEQVDNIIANDNPEGKQKIGYKRIIAKKSNAKERTLKKIQKQSINEIDEIEMVRKIRKPNAYREIKGNLPSSADQTEDKKIYTDDNSRIKAMKLSLNKHLSELSCISNESSQKKLDSTTILKMRNNDLNSKNDDEVAESKSYLASINEEIVRSDNDVFIPSQENDQNSIDFSMISNVRGGNHAETSIKKVENESNIHEQVHNIIANDNPEGKQKIGYKKIIAKKFNAKKPTLKKIPKQSIKEIDENKKVRKSKKPYANTGLQDNLFLHPNQSKYKKICTDDNARNETKLSLGKHLSALSCITNEVSQEKLDSTKILETKRDNDLNSKNDNETAESKSNLASINDEIIISTHTQENDHNSIGFPLINNINRDYGRINNGVQEKRKKPNINKLQLLDFPSNKRAPKEFILNKENRAKTPAKSSKMVENDCNIRGILLEQVDNIIVDPKTEQKIGKKRSLDKKSKVEEPKMKKIKKQCNNEVEEKNKVIESKQPNIYSGIQSTLLLPKNKEINTNNAENEADVNLVSQKKKNSTSVSDESTRKTGFCRKSETMLAAFPKWSDVPRTIAEQIEYFKNIKREKETELIIDDGFLFFAANRRAVNEYIKGMARGDKEIREGLKKFREARKELREYFKTNEEKKTS